MQNKIKLFKIIEHALNHGPIQVVMSHHNRDFLNECVQTLSEKSINRFKQGKPVDAIIIPVSLNDNKAKKIAQMKVSESARDFILENYALSKMVTRTFEITEPIAIQNGFDENLKNDALRIQQVLQDCGEYPTEREITELADFYCPMEDFDNYCERAFKQTKVHLLFTDIQNLSKKLQMRLNTYVQYRMRFLKIGYACGSDDLKTLSISDRHWLQETHDVNFRDIDSQYWRENIYDETKYDCQAESFKECDDYKLNLKKDTQQHKLPLKEFI